MERVLVWFLSMKKETCKNFMPIEIFFESATGNESFSMCQAIFRYIQLQNAHENAISGWCWLSENTTKH